MLPEITAENAAFWAGGARGELMIACCASCGNSIHPPEVVCPVCLSRDVAPRPAIGTGRIHARTVNRQQWTPDLSVPYVLAIVELDGEPGVRMTARVVDCDVDTPRIGAAVTVDFEPAGQDVWIPVFRLTGAGEAGSR